MLRNLASRSPNVTSAREPSDEVYRSFYPGFPLGDVWNVEADSLGYTLS
ncbi:hypothetical protein BC938DRAFT_474399 [Jimgerdemannia flammicorona]|uniref:Uncharacterized protein n=1 Tax=Jimgerdemannia flammicorona TaxID=994334 RepID=A0A433QZL8_9FUNG|nr:hypothetical protein BC938DRAFT_474399 [Jimgerdemannia flammicorona]